ncbi:uncharacterized protein LOC113293597 [Papaver somniferum]|uniref:uncharacterized protein LOC113293597 n=1 Tax=Papaver somniferum TaxID=3469 RepID=UPI000E700E63|nr:uncharacterized protein LOC113293597 [Papaver somniferum]
MPRKNTPLNSTSPAVFATPGASPRDGVSGGRSDLFQCPFKGLDGCKNGVGGKGLLKVSLLNHLKNLHYKREGGTDRFRERLHSCHEVYHAWEGTLQQLESWLCTHCMHIYALGKKCPYLDTHEPTPSSVSIHGVDAPVRIDVPVAAEFEVATPTPCLELLNTVFLAQIPTISSIPAKCRLHFARTFKDVLQGVGARPGDLAPWLQLLLFPICTLHVSESCQEEKTSTRKKMQIKSVNRALRVWSEPNGCVLLIQEVLEQHEEKKIALEKAKKKANWESREATNLRLCRSKLRSGLYDAAIRTLTSSGVAPNNDDTLAELRHKHPTAGRSSIPSSIPPHDAMIASTELVMSRLRSFPKGTSCGRDGFRAQHLLDVLSGPATVLSDDLIVSITDMVNLWLLGSFPSVLGEFICSSHPTYQARWWLTSHCFWNNLEETRLQMCCLLC